MTEQPSRVTHLVGTDFVWIYHWNVQDEEFYCIPVTGKPAVRDPVTVVLSDFAGKYNHLVIITRHLELFRARMNKLEAFNIKLVVVEDCVGHLIMKQLTADEIMLQRNQGTAVLIYCAAARRLYEFLKVNYYPFYIEAMGSYQNSVQCFFDHRRRKDPKFGSRGLFRIRPSDDVENSLEFISDSVDDHFPPYRITAFDVETARLDGRGRFPYGDTLHDRLCTVAFQTVTVMDAARPCDYSDVRNTLLVYLPTEQFPDTDTDNLNIVHCRSEEELVERTLAHLSQPDAVFVTGWNINAYDYRFLLCRALFYGLVPCYVSEWSLSRMCGLRDVFDLSPPWKLSVDSMLCRTRFFPRHLVNPPSNSLDVTAEALLGEKKADITITRVNQVYRDVELFRTLTNDQVSFLRNLFFYNLRDVCLVTKLNGVLQAVQTLVQLSQMADSPPGDCINYNSTKVGVAYMRNQFQSVVTAPIDYNVVYNSGNAGPVYVKNKYSPSLSLGRKGTTYKGATVLEPKVGVHLARSTTTSTLGCLDFASLYPSIMRTYGLMRGYVTRLATVEYEARKRELDGFFLALVMEDDPANVYLSLKSTSNIPIQTLCQSLIERRKAHKAAAPMMAHCLKILVNSLYGICGVRGVLYDQVTASMITGYGRHHLTKAINFFETRFVNLEILYGDTDSIFVACDRSLNPSLREMAAIYNTHLADTMELSAEATFECLILVRKKLYLAKLTDGGYKLSGFPQRVSPFVHRTMVEVLHQILDVTVSHPEDVAVNIPILYAAMFHKYVHDAETWAYNVKVKPLTSYQCHTGRNYHVGKMYEKKNRGYKITDEMYVSVCDVIPLVKKLPKKSVTVCLADDLDATLQTLNKSASLMEFLAQTFDPILEVVVPQTLLSLRKMSDEYVATLQVDSLLKHSAAGYFIYDFSARQCPTALAISVESWWPDFYQRFISDQEIRGGRNADGFFTVAVPWVVEDGPARNIYLRTSLHGKDASRFPRADDNNLSYVTVDQSPKSFLGTRKKFSSLKQLEEGLSGVLPAPLKMKKIFLKFDEQGQVLDRLSDILKLLCFVYNKPLCYTEMENMTTDRYLILLPFIAIRKDSGPSQFVFY